MMETPPSPTALAPLLLRNILLPLFIYTDKSLLHLTHRFKVFQVIRFTAVTAFFFFLKIIPSNCDHGCNSGSDSDHDYLWVPFFKPSKDTGKHNDAVDCSLAGDSCIARALTQLLAIINEIPVSSRKYEIVRSYAEKLMNENLEEGYEPLRRVNVTVLSRAFSRALGQLELVAEAGALGAADGEGEVTRDEDAVKSGFGFGLNRAIKTVACCGVAAWTRFGRRRRGRLGGSAEKLSAELLWLAEKLAACGGADEAVRQWAAASKLALVALSAQPRLQGSLVKLSAFLFTQATYMCDEDGDESDMEEQRKAKLKILMSWLPFLCRASTGTDSPVLSFDEKAELENVLGALIGSLKHEDEQEKVLSLWLHHFTRCQSSDWPNLHPCYAKWCTASRKLLILGGK